MKESYSVSTEHKSPNFWTAAYIARQFNHTRRLLIVVLHKTEGHFDSDLATLTDGNRANPVSAHYLLHPDCEANPIFQLVREEDIAWHCGTSALDKLGGPFRKVIGWGNENYDTIGIEISAKEWEAFSVSQYQALGWLVNDICTRNRITPDRIHIVFHKEISRQKSDPQLFDYTEFTKSLSYYQNKVQPPRLYFPQTGHYVQGGFKGLYEKYGLVVTGYPLTEEYSEDATGLTIQRWENVVMEYKVGTDPRIGAIGTRYCG